MSIDYLEDMEASVTNGRKKFACPGPNANEWHIADNVEDLRPKAQRTADARRFQTHIYRLINRMETVTGDSYLVVRKILEPGPRGEPHFQWSVVDTREAAEMLRDVSQGPTPFFGAVVEETFNPR
ncbi:MAG: hypothetical protein U0136_20335 [Bdellovibrionota bacterium]